jgi:DmsE family decaheme c-type cytochrome
MIRSNGKLYAATIFGAVMLFGPAMSEELDWASLNPDLADAVTVSDIQECTGCHDDYLRAYATTHHGRNQVECESCHGPASKHLKSPRKKPTLMVSFSEESGLTSGQKASVCLQCHEGSKRTYWQGGPHEASDVSCNSCHYVMARRSDTALTMTEDASEICLTCHLEKRGQILKSSHMPVREGKMNCADCHNPHGSFGRNLLKTATVNDSCYQCHADKRGPFLWEHAPVREDCSNCHNPHGSNNPGMLTNKETFLCLSCHQYGGHVNMPRYNRVSASTGQGCVTCHNRVHGSNHPSGSKLTR